MFSFLVDLLIIFILIMVVLGVIVDDIVQVYYWVIFILWEGQVDCVVVGFVVYFQFGFFINFNFCIFVVDYYVVGVSVCFQVVIVVQFW